MIDAPITSDTVHPAWVQTAENALNSPVLGWVSTTSPTTIPEPTGTSAVAAKAAVVSVVSSGPGDSGAAGAGVTDLP
ncbi:hypothetical protein [Mycolicibacterium vanbaalenii]|uniref:hypothetical protein n=1 Tax=Mycolicibacterium vanbaalenii TaxID=110539 RepID=UPI0027E32818|nr:hypothetical protein [Mycolicibacterium vanbaalenii]